MIRKLIVAIFLLAVVTAALGQTFTVGKYQVTGGKTMRSDADRWNDAWTSAPEIGVDCTNTNDSTRAIQNWANAHLNGGRLNFPVGCRFFTTATITITDGVDVMFTSTQYPGQGAGSPAQWIWKGSNGGAGCTTNFASCVYVVDFEHTDSPVVENLLFTNFGSPNCPDGYLKFDGNPGAQHIGTQGIIRKNVFNNGQCANANFVAINISPTATGNQENYVVDENEVTCSNSSINSFGGLVANNGVTNSGSAVVTSASNPFTVGMVGKRIRLAFGGTGGNAFSGNGGGGVFDTTIAGFANAGSITLAAPVPFSQSPVTVAVGESYGIAFRNGASQNAIQQKVNHLIYVDCAYGVYVAGGGVQVWQLSGGFSDVGAYFGGFRAQNSTLDYYAAENDYISVMEQPGSGAPFEISNSRFSNGVMAGNGFIQLGGGRDQLRNNLVNFGLPNTNSVLIGPYHATGVYAVGNLVGGSGYVNGTYNNVQFTNLNTYATIVVAGGSVTSVTITTPGANGAGLRQVLTTANTNLGGSGSGFSVTAIAVGSPGSPQNNTTPVLTSINNNWAQGCCGTGITWANLGFSFFVSPAVLSAYDNVAAIPNSINFGCPTYAQTTGCLYIDANYSHNGFPFYGVNVNTRCTIVTCGTLTGIRVQGEGSGVAGNSPAGYVAFQAVPNLSTGVQTLFDAAWNGEASAPLGGAAAAYGFHAETPTAVTGGSGVTLYGFECDQQKVTNVGTGWCFYNANASDKNFLAGNLLLGNNGLTVPAGGLGLAKITADGVAPGAAGGKIELVCGTNAGTAKLIAYAGTSTTPVTILDNIGGGVTGC
jgi:hypothetical protein